MQNFIKSLRGLGPAGSALANLLVFLTTNWGVVVSAAFALLTALWGEALSFVSQPGVLDGLVVFIVIFWTYLGFLLLIDRKKPKLVKPYQNYDYGLTFEGFAPAYNANSEAMLQIGLLLRNYGPGPIYYSIEHFDVRIETRSIPKIKKGVLRGILPRGAARRSSQAPFMKTDLAEYQNKDVKGTIEFIITYGPPNEKPVRALKMIVEIYLNMGTFTFGFSDNIIEESDSDYIDGFDYARSN